MLTSPRDRIPYTGSSSAVYSRIQSMGKGYTYPHASNEIRGWRVRRNFFREISFRYQSRRRFHISTP